MKVLIVSTLYHPNVFGGAEKSTQSLAEALVAQGHDVAVATLNPERRYEAADVNGVRVHYLPVKNLYFPTRPRQYRVAKVLWHAVDSYNPFMAVSLGRVLDAERPDVVNTQNLSGFSTSVWGVVKKRHLPLVHTIRDHYLLCPRADMYRAGQNCNEPCAVCRVYGRPRIHLSCLVDVVTGISRYILDVHDRHACFPRADKLVVCNACGPAPRATLPVRRPNGNLCFGFLGRLHPIKGVDLLIRSFLCLPQGRAELLIAGQGTTDYVRELKRMSEGCSNVRWLGFVQPATLFDQVDVLAVPSLWREAAGRVVLESMAHHVPVIGSCRGGIPEQMGEGTGWVFDPDEPGALTRTLRRALDSRGELAAMGERAGERARQFSTEAMVNGYLSAFSCAIDKAGQTRKVVSARRQASAN